MVVPPFTADQKLLKERSILELVLSNKQFSIFSLRNRSRLSKTAAHVNLMNESHLRSQRENSLRKIGELDESLRHSCSNVF